LLVWLEVEWFTHLPTAWT